MKANTGLMSGVGGLFSGLAGYNQAHSQKQALGHAIGQAGKIPGMIDRMYQPGMERTQDLYNMYNPRGGQMFKNLQQNLGSVFNQNIGQVDPAMRKMLSRGNVAKAGEAMGTMLPQFTQTQIGLSGQLAGMEHGMGQAKIGAHENLAQLQAAQKAINPSAQALGSFGASLMSMVQGGGKVKKQSGDKSKGLNEEQLFNLRHGYPTNWTYDDKQDMASRYKQDYFYNEHLLKDYFDSMDNYDSYYHWLKDKKDVDRAKKIDVREKIQGTFDKDTEDDLMRTTNPLFRDQRVGSVFDDGSWNIYTGDDRDFGSPHHNILDIVSTVRQAENRKKEIDERISKENQAKEDFANKVLGSKSPFLDEEERRKRGREEAKAWEADFIDKYILKKGDKNIPKAGGGYISGPHHGAGGVDMGNNIEAQGGEFMMNANAYNKNPSMLEALNMNDNEMTVMNGFFGDKHSAHGNSLNMQEGGELDANDMSDYQKYLVVRGNKPSEFKDEADFNNQKQHYEMQNGGGVMNEGTILNKIIKKTYGM